MNPFKRTFHFIHHHLLAKRHLIAIDCYGTLNTIYIKDINLALKKIKSSKKFKIFGEMI